MDTQTLQDKINLATAEIAQANANFGVQTAMHTQTINNLNKQIADLTAQLNALQV